MKEKCKSLLNYLKVLSETIISVLSVLLFSRKTTIQYFRKVKESIKEENNSLYILGNGSSLSNFLNEPDNLSANVMVVNYFATSPFFRKIKPLHYIMLDNNLCIKPDEGNEFLQQKLITALLEVDWNIYIYMPSDSDTQLIDSFKENRNITLILFNRTPVTGLRLVSYWLYNKCLGMPRPQNVLNAAIFCAMLAGFKTIYLYGAEHSWTKSFDVDPSNHRVFLNDGHFYEKDNIRYLPKGEYMRWLIDISSALNSHYKLREYADYLGVKVVNKTAQSFVEAYEYE